MAVARALINHPPVLLADEPTGNLDSRTSREVLEMFQRLTREEGITIVLVTHDPEVARHAERVIRIYDGVIRDASAGDEISDEQSGSPTGLREPNVSSDAGGGL